jgi:hypothetical protein
VNKNVRGEGSDNSSYVKAALPINSKNLLSLWAVRCFAYKFRKDAKLVYGLNHHTDIVTQHFAQRFVDLSIVGFGPEIRSKLGFDHRKSGLDIAPLVVALIELLLMI